MGSKFTVATEGKLKGVFTGFSEGSQFSEYEVFCFMNGDQWQQDEPYYYYFGPTIEPIARVIKYGDSFFIIVDAIPDEVNQILPRPVKVKSIND